MRRRPRARPAGAAAARWRLRGGRGLSRRAVRRAASTRRRATRRALAVRAACLRERIHHSLLLGENKRRGRVVYERGGRLTRERGIRGPTLARAKRQNRRTKPRTSERRFLDAPKKAPRLRTVGARERELGVALGLVGVGRERARCHVGLGRARERRVGHGVPRQPTNTLSLCVFPTRVSLLREQSTRF